MMSSTVAGIDPHQDTFTVGDRRRQRCRDHTRHASPTAAPATSTAIELLSSHGVEQVGVEGSASWGSHVAIALVAAGFDAREVPPQRSAAAASSAAPGQDRHRRCGVDGTGAVGRAIARSGAGARGV